MKTTIWTEDDYLKLAPINDELIKKAEEVLNVKLPESYINLLKEQNGGTLRLDAHPSPSINHNTKPNPNPSPSPIPSPSINHSAKPNPNPSPSPRPIPIAVAFEHG